MELMPQDEEQRAPVWVLIRDVGVLQVKLIVDGLRDLILVPASLIAGVVSLIRTENGKPGHEFYQLVSVGKQSEKWINLFGALRNAPPEVMPQDHFGDRDMDELVSRVEKFVVDEYQRGGWLTKAGRGMDRAFDNVSELQRKARRRGAQEAQGKSGSAEVSATDVDPSDATGSPKDS